jgi:fermentation-respiration switch protein FrsA (DUF1100 family)
MAQDDWDGFGVVEPDAFSWSLKTPEFGKSAGRTADPSASLGMTKGSAVLSGETGLWMRGTADPSASLGMTKGSAVLSGEIGLWMRGTAGPSALRDVDERS